MKQIQFSVALAFYIIFYCHSNLYYFIDIDQNELAFLI